MSDSPNIGELNVRAAVTDLCEYTWPSGIEDVASTGTDRREKRPDDSAATFNRHSHRRPGG
jgi:hypothetical protein